MMIMLHVIIALASLCYSTYTLFSPSKAKLHGSYVLVGLTLATGTYLVVSMPAHILEACTVGLLYVVAVTAAIVATRHKLTAA